MSDATRDESRRLASVVSVRLAPDEEERVREEASRRGETMSGFFRAAALSQCGINHVVGPQIYQGSVSTVGSPISFDLGSDGQLVARSTTGAYVSMTNP